MVRATFQQFYSVFLVFCIFLEGCEKNPQYGPLYIVDHRHPVDVSLKKIGKPTSKSNFHLFVKGYIEGSGSIIIKDSSGIEVFTDEIKDSVSITWNYSGESDSFLLTYIPKDVEDGKLKINYYF